jgi:Protein of unknown function (DUF2949)
VIPIDRSKLSKDTKFIHFLTEELDLSSDSLSIALRHPEKDPSLLSMVLWQYGLITIEQLERIYDWMETV